MGDQLSHQNGAKFGAMSWLKGEAVPVQLHIYDIGSRAGKLNQVLRALGTGFFHCGVEVYGLEWSFGDVPDPGSGSGVFCSQPKCCQFFMYRESIQQGSTEVSYREFQRMIVTLAKEWPAKRYDALLRNCCDFSDDLCSSLGVAPLPSWVRNAADSAERLGTMCDLACEQAARRSAATCTPWSQCVNDEGKGSAVPEVLDAQTGRAYPTHGKGGLQASHGGSPRASPGLTSPRASPRFTSPRAPPRLTSPRASPRFTSPRASPRPTSPRASPRLASPRPTSPGASPRGLTSPLSSPRPAQSSKMPSAAEKQQGWQLISPRPQHTPRDCWSPLLMS